MSDKPKSVECPYCGNEIPRKLIFTFFAKLGGHASRRTISPEQQELMQRRAREAREEKLR